MRSMLIGVSTLLFCVSAHAVEYTMVKGDTLWALSKQYLKDPYQWPRITYLDGTTVTEPRKMPIGTLLLIPNEIANARAILELPATTQIKAKDTKSSSNAEHNTSVSKVKHISNPTIEAIVNKLNESQQAKLWNYYLTHKEGLVRAYYNGREVVIEAEILIDEMRHQQGKSK